MCLKIESVTGKSHFRRMNCKGPQITNKRPELNLHVLPACNKFLAELTLFPTEVQHAANFCFELIMQHFQQIKWNTNYFKILPDQPFFNPTQQYIYDLLSIYVSQWKFLVCHALKCLWWSSQAFVDPKQALNPFLRCGAPIGQILLPQVIKW